MLSLVFVKNIRNQRWVYWLTWLVAGSLMSLAALGRGVASVCIAAAAAAAIAWLYAYLRTSFIKINGHIYTYTIPNSRPDPPGDGSPPPPVLSPDDAYGNVLTAPKLWWTNVVFVCAASILALDLGMSPPTLGATVLAIVLLAITGYLDAREGSPIARRQFLQLGLIAVASIPVFLAPPIAYALLYWTRGGSFRLSHRDAEA